MNQKKRDPEHYFAANPKSEARYGIVQTHLCGRRFEFLTASSVFSTKKVDLGTRLLIESMVLPQKGCILDLGCGYGPIGIVAAALNPKLYVILTDVNIRAVRLATQNIQRNKIMNAEARRGFLYEPVKDFKFTCILSNPPVSAGMDIVRAIVDQAPESMANESNLQMVVRSKIGAKTLPAIFNETFGNVKTLDRKSGYRILIGQKFET
jgi:16S rRNA (guanine1207-N2)-methyltransferase